MGDRVRVQFPVRDISRYVTSHPDQLSLAIPSWVGAMSTSRSVQLSLLSPTENRRSIVKHICRTELKLQVAQLSQRDRAARWVSYGQKWKDWNWENGHSTTATYLASKVIKFGENAKRWAITSFQLIQDHRGRYQSKARMLLPISDN